MRDSGRILKPMVLRNRGKSTVIAVIFLVLAGVTALWLLGKKTSRKPTPLAITPATAPATAPATRPLIPVPAPQDLLGVVRAANPAYPTTRELDIPGNYDQAAHLVIDEPVYLCPAGHLWVTHPRGLDAATLLGKLGEGNSHVTRDRIVFAHWQLSDAGKWITALVRQNSDGEFELVQPNKITPLR